MAWFNSGPEYNHPAKQPDPFLTWGRDQRLWVMLCPLVEPDLDEIDLYYEKSIENMENGLEVWCVRSFTAPKVIVDYYAKQELRGTLMVMQDSSTYHATRVADGQLLHTFSLAYAVEFIECAK